MARAPNATTPPGLGPPAPSTPPAPPAPGVRPDAGLPHPDRGLIPLWMRVCMAGFAVVLMVFGLVSIVKQRDVPSNALWAVLGGAALFMLMPILHRLNEFTLKMGDKELIFKLQERVRAAEAKADATEAKVEGVKEVAQSALSRSMSDTIDAGKALKTREREKLAAIASDAGAISPRAREIMLEQIPLADVNQEELASISRSDPTKGKFGGASTASGRVLSAKVEPLGGANDFFRVVLEVRSTDPVNRPLSGVVTFFLHPTFPRMMLRTPVLDGRAVQTLLSWGAFTVGALADDGATELELDMADEAFPAPAVFKGR